MREHENMWECDVPINEHAALRDVIDVPEWVEQDITPQDVAAIVQGGCDSGAYMPAVTYHSALDTMRDHGDDVFDYIENAGDLRQILDTAEPSWSGLACAYLSAAVELWAHGVEDEIANALGDYADSEGDEQ